MSTIYHITTAAEWHAAYVAGAYSAPSLASEGFIHLSTRDQLVATAERHFSNQSNLLIIAVDTERLLSELRYEEGRPGEQFPHLYGPLNLDAVAGIFGFPQGPDGSFKLPPGI